MWGMVVVAEGGGIVVTCDWSCIYLFYNGLSSHSTYSHTPYCIDLPLFIYFLETGTSFPKEAYHMIDTCDPKICCW